jgi:hypothetical protein
MIWTPSAIEEEMPAIAGLVGSEIPAGSLQDTTKGSKLYARVMPLCSHMLLDLNEATSWNGCFR